MSTDLRAHGAEILRPLEELSKVEAVKAGSRQLRGTIGEELQNASPEFSDPAEALLKFHGIYQQDDRDARKSARKSGGGKQHIMMVRTRIPGGIVSAEAYLAHDEVAGRYANGTLRITTRQDFQLHGVLKGNLKATIRHINDALLTTLGGCGDQERNIVCCPLPRKDAFSGEITEALRGLVRNLTPTTQAYTEIWLDGLQLTGTEPEVDELYGSTYLPRKFKTAVAPEGDNCVDVYSNDLGFVAHRAPGGGLAGFTVMVGGGLGRTHHKPDTFPLLAQPMAFVTPDQAIAVARAVVAVQRDFGNRHDRKHARLKYVIHERGLDWFRARVQEQLSFTLAGPRPVHWEPYNDHLGWYEQGDGFLAYGLFVENGRIQDTPELALRTVLRRVVKELRPRVVLTPQQNLILSGIAPRDRGRVEEVFAVNAVRPLQALPMSLRHSMACPALPTCGQAVAEAERVAPALIRQIGAVINELGLQGERISYRMAGCPNACSRPYLGDVGIVGTTLGKYDIHLGGDIEGTRLNAVFAENIPLERVSGVLRSALEAFAVGRVPGETFGNFCHRVGVATLATRVLPATEPRGPAAAQLDALVPVAAGNGSNGGSEIAVRHEAAAAVEGAGHVPAPDDAVLVPN
jgi:sulfite reductase (ferredoxin)